MSNYLKMEKKETFRALLGLGWSYRRIERETGVRRETISKYAEKERPKAAKVPPGEAENRPGCPPGTASRCEEYRALIESKLRQGLTAKRIYQDLVFEAGFEGSYDSVKRFRRGLKERRREVFARLEAAPGEEVQVDFGRGALTRLESGDPIVGRTCSRRYCPTHDTPTKRWCGAKTCGVSLGVWSGPSRPLVGPKAS